MQKAPAFQRVTQELTRRYKGYHAASIEHAAAAAGLGIPYLSDVQFAGMMKDVVGSLKRAGPIDPYLTGLEEVKSADI